MRNYLQTLVFYQVFRNRPPTIPFHCVQVLGVMDRLWKAGGLDLKVITYGCVATGDMLGLLEIVGNSATGESPLQQFINCRLGGWPACSLEP